MQKIHKNKSCIFAFHMNFALIFPQFVYWSWFSEVSNWKWEKCEEHQGTSCKITAQTDKNCGNESRICETIFKNYFKNRIFCFISVFKFKIKSDFKFHIKTKHVQMFFMLCFYVNLNIRFSFEFGDTHRTISNAEKLKVILAMSLSSSLFYWSSLYSLSLSFVCFQIQNSI